MRAVALISGLVGVIAGIAGDQLWRSHDGEAAPTRENSARDAAAGRFEQCVARLDAIDAQLAKLAAAPAAPTRTEAGESLAPKLEERLAAIEAAIGRLTVPAAASVRSREDPPRAARDAATFDRLFEAEYAKRLVRRDDHLGYTADRLYERYGAPDYIWADPNDTSRRVTWAYKDSNGARGVNFWLQDGLVVDEGAWQR